MPRFGARPLGELSVEDVRAFVADLAESVEGGELAAKTVNNALVTLVVCLNGAARKGILVLGLPLIAPTTPAPTWWAHDSGCAWAAAWLTVRGRTFLGQRELLDDPEWSGHLHWLDRHSLKRSGHRPDLVGFISDMAVTEGIIYICGDEEGCRRIERAGQRVGLYRTDSHFRIETLDTIEAQTVAGFKTTRRAAGRTAA